jgi:ribosomal protein S18 acetylase RimI-like enzyme
MVHPMVKKDVVIRDFKEEDYWQVENLVREFMNKDPYSPPIIVRQMQDLFGRFFLVAQNRQNKNHEILGYIMGAIEYDSKTGWILEIYVKEEFRNNDIGYELLKELIYKLEKASISEIRLTVDPQNISAINVYERNGFQKVDCLNEHYRKEKKVYLMKKTLA